MLRVLTLAFVAGVVLAGLSGGARVAAQGDYIAQMRALDRADEVSTRLFEQLEDHAWFCRSSRLCGGHDPVVAYGDDWLRVEREYEALTLDIAEALDAIHPPRDAEELHRRLAQTVRACAEVVHDLVPLLPRDLGPEGYPASGWEDFQDAFAEAWVQKCDDPLYEVHDELEAKGYVFGNDEA